MTTVKPATRLTPSAQIQQFCNAITSLFGSLTESTDSAFRLVHVTKRDASGNIRFYDKREKVIDPDTGASTIITTKISDLTYIEDVKTGELYLDEPTYIVATKCSLVALGMPMYAVAKMGWYTLKTPLEIGSIALRGIAGVGQLFFSGSFYPAAKEAQRGIVQIFEVSGTGLFEIVKAPLFALGCELMAIYGIFKPYHGRKFEALIENAWQQGAWHKLDFRNVAPCANEDCLIYFAKCFQVRGSTRDPLVTVTARNRLAL